MTNNYESQLTRQRERDLASRQESESLLGREVGIFRESMGLIISLWDEVLSADSIDERLKDLTLKHKLTVLHYGFNLLWAAWEEALAGRYQTATDHFRSIEECPDFLLALWLKPELSNDWTDRTSLNAKTARRTIADALKQPGAGSDLLRSMQIAATGVQAFSHVSVQSLGQALPLKEEEGGMRLLVRLGGEVSPISLTLVAAQIVNSTLQLLGAALLAFDDVVRLEPELFERWFRRIAEHRDTLAGQRDGLRDVAPAHGLLFAASQTATD